jgi:cysteine desulfurase
LEGEALLLRLDQAGFCVSTGSACATGQREASHVLKAMAVPAEEARGTIRVSLSRGTEGLVVAEGCGDRRELRNLKPFQAK